MPRLRGEGYGDLYARARVVLPTEARREAEAAARAFLDLVDQPDPGRRPLTAPQPPHPKDQTMQLDRFTQKAQEAIVAAQQLAAEAQSPRPRRRAPPLRARRARRRRARRDPPPARRRPARVPRRARRDPRPGAPGSRAARCPSTRGRSGSSSWPRARPAGSATSTSRPSTCCSASLEVGGEGQPAAREPRRRPRGGPRRAPERPRRPARHLAEPRGHLPGAREVRPRPDRRGPGRQARPGHRPRRGDPPGHPGPVAGGRRTTRS